MLNLRALRKSKGLTMKQLGEKIGVAESTISLYERGEREPDNATLIKLANYFIVSVDYLLGRADNPGFSPEEKTFGITETKKETVTPLEDDLLYEFRELGKIKGEEFQNVVIEYIRTLKKI